MISLWSANRAMANYECWAKSNHFKVKDIEGLRKSLERFSGLMLDHIIDNLYIILPDEDFNVYKYTDENYDFEDKRLDPQVDIIPYLEDDEIFITFEVGHEKQRYMCGYAQAFCKDKEPIAISTEDIYALALKSFGIDVRYD